MANTTEHRLDLTKGKIQGCLQCGHDIFTIMTSSQIFRISKLIAGTSEDIIAPKTITAFVCQKCGTQYFPEDLINLKEYDEQQQQPEQE
jgi:hypothetical protein